MLGVLLVASLITTAGEAGAAAPAALDGCVAAPIGEDGWDPVAGGAAGEIQPKELLCRIAGVAAACTWVTVSEGPRRFVANWGGVTLKGVPTIAFCTSDGQATIPSPCSTVFEAR